MINVVEIMNRGPFVTIGPRARVAEAAAVSRASAVSHLLVTDAEVLIGVVCICDLDEAPELEVVENVMTRQPLCLEPGASAGEAVELMQVERISLLPVVDAGVLVGVVGRRDLRAAGLIVDGLGEHAACASCGSHRHVRAHEPMQVVGFCLDCRRSSRPPTLDDELGEAD
jgi:CBS domain-containing protein